MPVPDSVLRLINTFAEHIEHYRSAKYNETQLRREFLDPFFKALGWDIENEAGYADAYKDVIHEDAISIGGSTKAPDYCFRIGGTRKFFLEAKRPGLNIKEASQPAYQIRRYAWSAKLPISILSDFEEFAVYDTQIKPAATDSSATARLIYCSYQQYPEKWDELAQIFSREAVLKGSFDQFAAGTKKKRGTAQVDDAFLAEIERWRDVLARNLAARNANLSVRDLNFAVQKIIDRIIFLRICEDRGTEHYGRLQSASNDSGIYKSLTNLFLEADKRYDSGLFHFSTEKGECSEPDRLTLDLNLDDKSLKDILRHLYYPESPYELSVLPADILGQIYERFLGKTITLTSSHKAKIEEKPEVRKAGGVYYTPTYVVDYIVDATLGHMLNGNDLEQPRPIPVSQAAQIKVVDPACGSGSFLIAAYQFLLDWHLKRYTENASHHSRGKNPRIYEGRGGVYRLTTGERKRILLNNIFGVDIDHQAVEVTKLSLLLKVLEGETDQIVQRDWIKQRQRILPDLGANIRCGNTLIGPELYASTQTLLLGEEDHYRINAFDWNEAFPKVFAQGGFDCIIGNPPYGATLDRVQKDFFAATYTCQSYQLDSYLLFLERSLSRLMKSKGRCGFIIPNPWLTNVRQQATRRYICNAASIEQIVHFDFPVFKSAVVDTEIVILKKPLIRSNMVDIWAATAVRADGTMQSKPITSHSQKEWISLDGEAINIFMTAEDKKLLRKIGACSRELQTWFKINVGIKPYQIGKGTPKQTKNIVRDRPFDALEKKDETYRKLIRGKDFNRYYIAPIETMFISYGVWLAEPRPAADFDAPEKIVVRQTGDRPIAAYDVEQRLTMNNVHVLVPHESGHDIDIRYFLALINSDLMTWAYRCLNPEAGEALAEVKKTHVAKLPIYDMNLGNPSEKQSHDKIVSVTNQVLDLYAAISFENNPDSRKRIYTRIKAAEEKINAYVYELYSLSKDEIEVIEKSIEKIDGY